MEVGLSHLCVCYLWQVEDRKLEELTKDMEVVEACFTFVFVTCECWPKPWRLQRPVSPLCLLPVSVDQSHGGCRGLFHLCVCCLWQVEDRKLGVLTEAMEVAEACLHQTLVLFSPLCVLPVAGRGQKVQSTDQGHRGCRGLSHLCVCYLWQVEDRKLGALTKAIEAAEDCLTFVCVTCGR